MRIPPGLGEFREAMTMMKATKPSDYHRDCGGIYTKTEWRALLRTREISLTRPCKADDDGVRSQLG